MNTTVLRWAPLAALLLAACGAAPKVSYYTLVRPPEAANAVARSPVALSLVSVVVPAQVDQPALVLRRSGETLEPVETRQWIAPLPDEARSALDTRLRTALGIPVADALPLEAAVEITRFELALAHYALVEARWKLSAERGGARDLACSSRQMLSVGEGYEALVAGQQQALVQLADQIAAAARSLAANSPACP